MGRRWGLADDGVSGTWDCMVTGGQNLPPGGMPFKLNLTVAADGKVSGSVTSAMGSGGLTGTYDKGSGALTITIAVVQQSVNMTCMIEKGQGGLRYLERGERVRAWSGSVRTAGPSASAARRRARTRPSRARSRK